MDQKIQKKNLSVYQIFKRNQDASYPQLLAKYIQNPNSPKFQIQKAEMLLNIWTDQYKIMPQINKSTYYNVIPRFLKLLYSIYVSKNKGEQSLSTMYFIFYKKWPQVTSLIKKGLKQNNIQILILLWKISFNMVKAIKQIQRQQFGLFLSQQFQDVLSKYKWSCHAERMYILQILKYINNDILYDAFIENGKQWSQVVKAMKNQQLKSQIPIQKQGELRLKVFKYQYEQSKKQKKFTTITGNTSNLVTKSDKKKQGKQKTFYQKQMQKKLQKQYLNREQINLFLVVKDKQEEQQIYRLQLISQIISNRPLFSKICEQFWQSQTLKVIQQFYQKLETLSIQSRMHVLLAKVFLGLLRYKKTSHIIKQKIGEQIVVKIINNIEKFQTKSPFQTPALNQIPTLVNKSFFEVTPQMIAQGITFQTLINKRIKSIIDNANAGKDDIVSRSLMTVVCKEQIVLKQPILKQINSFLLNIRKKKNLFIETSIILAKVLFSAFHSPDLKQFNLYPLSLILAQNYELFNQNNKLNQLRKINIQLLELFLPIVAADQRNDQISKITLIQSTLKFLQLSERNFSFVFCSMIYILKIMINCYRETLLTQDRSMDLFSKILFGMMQKLSIEHKSQNMFAYLDCILKAYVQLQWSEAYVIYEQIPEEYYKEWQIIYRKQAQILFKKQDQLKWNKKMQIEKISQDKNQKKSKYSKKYQDQNKKSSENLSKLGKIDVELQKRCQQKMQLFFGKLQKKWFKDLINNHQLWTKQQLIKAQIAILQFSLIQTISDVEKQYYITSQSPNKFFKNIILQLDDDLHNLFAYLIDSQIYQLLFMFASQLFFICRDFFFVIQLKSFQILQNKCFQILSVFFNKVQILYASSTFCSLFLPYFNNPKELKNVYDYLNRQQFITDLFKGSSQFIGKQKCYYPWLIKILMAYQVTQQFRQGKRLIKQALVSLGKNVVWWGNVDYLVNAQIQVDDQDSKQSKILVFEIFKDQYKKMMAEYFNRVENIIQVQKKHKQLMSNLI